MTKQITAGATPFGVLSADQLAALRGRIGEEVVGLIDTMVEVAHGRQTATPSQVQVIRMMLARVMPEAPSASYNETVHIHSDVRKLSKNDLAAIAARDVSPSEGTSPPPETAENSHSEVAKAGACAENVSETPA